MKKIKLDINKLSALVWLSDEIQPKSLGEMKKAEKLQAKILLTPEEDAKAKKEDGSYKADVTVKTLELSDEDIALLRHTLEQVVETYIKEGKKWKESKHLTTLDVTLNEEEKE